MENQNKDTQPKTIVKKRSRDEIRGYLAHYRTPVDPDMVLAEADKVLTNAKDGTKMNSEDEKKVTSAVFMLGHERHYLVAESVTEERWRPMVMDLATQIQNEYQCMTASEIALAGLASASYFRALRAGRRMNALLCKESFGDIGVNLLGQVSKEIDRAERQYLSAIEILRNRRQPQINVKVQTKTAFFGENQTFNAGQKQNYETNDPQ